jgi:hypothetical protein
MKIYKYEVPNDMVFEYCEVITILEKKFDASLEQARHILHDQIYNHVKNSRVCITKDDRNFSIALDRMVCNLTYKV